MSQRVVCFVGLFLFTFFPPGTATAQRDFSAETVLQEADELYSRLEPSEQAVGRLLDLVSLYRKTEQPELGETYLADARRKTFNDQSRAGLSHNRLISFYLSQGDVKNAYGVAHESPRLSRNFLAQKMMFAELHRGDWNKAARYLGYRYHRSNYDNLAYTFQSFACSSYELGMLDEAMDLIDAKIEDADEVVSIKSQVWAKLARKAWDSKDKEAAFQRHDRALEFMRPVGSLRKSARYYLLLTTRAYWADQLDQKLIKQIFEDAEQNNVDMYQVKQHVAAILAKNAERIDLLKAVVEGFEGEQQQIANLKLSLARGYINNRQLEEAIVVLNSIEGDKLKSQYFVSLATHCFGKGMYRIAIRLVDISKTFLDQPHENPKKQRIRDRRLADANRTKYLSQSLVQRKILIPDTVSDNDRFELLVDLVEILVEASE